MRLETVRKIESIIKDWFTSAGWTMVANTPDLIAYKGRDGEVNISAISRRLADSKDAAPLCTSPTQSE